MQVRCDLRQFPHTGSFLSQRILRSGVEIETSDQCPYSAETGVDKSSADREDWISLLADLLTFTRFTALQLGRSCHLASWRLG